MRIYHATLKGITAIETPHKINERVDATQWEAWSPIAASAQSLLVDALKKRVAGLESQLKRGNEMLQQAIELKLPQE